MREWSTTTCIPNIGNRWVSGQLHTLTILLLEKQPLVPSGWVLRAYQDALQGLQKKIMTFTYVKKRAPDY